MPNAAGSSTARFSPAGLIPWDLTFADTIEASINEYLEEQ